jgi:hypothetical protein
VQPNGPLGSGQMGMQQLGGGNGGGGMMMGNGMIPVPGGPGNGQLPSMVPIGGGMQPQNAHLAQPMQGAARSPCHPVVTCSHPRRAEDSGGHHLWLRLLR